MTTTGERAAAVMKHLVEHDGGGGHGYTQGNRWGNGVMEDVDALGVSVRVAGGDRDCSSACISAWEAVGMDCGGATYTGNMASCMCATGNFERRPKTFIASPGDMYLNEGAHVAMCLRQEPDELMQFSQSENGGVYGRVGDQTGRESSVGPYYDFPWDCILHYVGGDAEPPSAGCAAPEVRYRASTDPAGLEWLPEMVGHVDSGGSSDTWAGDGEHPIRWLAVGMPGWYQARTEACGWLPPVRGYDTSDLANGCAGDGSPILAVRCYYETKDPASTGWLAVEYQTADANEGFGPVMRDLEDSGGSADDFAGDGDAEPVTRFRARLVRDHADHAASR